MTEPTPDTPPDLPYGGDDIPEDARPTQAAHPWRATVRTLFAALVGLAAMAPLLVEASGADETWGPVAGVLAVTGAITRILAVPQVNDFLEQFLPFLSATGGK